MPLYRVFLPPEKLAPLPLPTKVEDYSPLSFEDVEIPVTETCAQLDALTRTGDNITGAGVNESQPTWSLQQSVFAERASFQLNELATTDIRTRSQVTKDFEEEERNSWEKSAIAHPAFHIELSGAEEAQDDGRGLKKRRINLGEAPDGGQAGPADVRPGSIASGQSLPDLSGRRRSGRLGQARTSLSMLGTLPPGDFTESMLSLNTTASYPSQLSQPPLPTWHIPLSRLAPLPTVLGSATNSPALPFGGGKKRGRQAAGSDEANRTYTVMVCIVSTDGPVLRRRKEEKEKGKDGTLWIASWRVIAPEPSESLDTAKLSRRSNLREGQTGDTGCKVQLWDDCARDWASQVRRGDVVLLENIELRPSTPKEPAHLSASNRTAHPKMTVLYRTLPREAGGNPYIYPGGSTKTAGGGVYAAEDAALRPDLRLARSDPGVRKVAEMAAWFAHWVGGVPPPDI